MGAVHAERDSSAQIDSYPTESDRPAPLRPRTGRLLCWLLLAVLLGASGWAVQFSAASVEHRREYVFLAETAMLRLRLEEQLQPYQNLSRILVGFFLASDRVNLQEWHVFLRAQQLDRSLPRLERAWFAFDASNERAPHYQTEREMAGNSSLRPASGPTAARRLPLLYLEPVLADPIDTDLYAANAASIERAYQLRDTLLAPQFLLLPQQPAGFAFITPFIRPDELAGSAQPALEGVLGVSFNFEDLLQQLLAGAPAGIGLEVHRGERIDDDSLLIASGRSRSASDHDGLQRTETVIYAGQPLTLLFHAPPDWSAAELEQRAPLYVALGGLVISLLGFAIARSLESTRERAMAIAERMTVELRDINRVLAQMATTDSLTELFNRRAFFDRLRAELLRVQRYREPVALLLFDIDHFKQINDTHGHPAGDTVLKAVGDLLRRELRAADSAGRIGGEEFAVLLPHTGLEQAGRVAEQLRKALGALRHDENGVAFQCSASFGVTASTDGHESAELLMRRADRALYRAKSAGRNRVELATPDSDPEP